MNPDFFPEKNKTFEAGKTSDGLSYGQLHTYHGLRPDETGRKWPVFISKHVPSKAELFQQLLEPGVYIEITSSTQPPVIVHGFSPFMTYQEVLNREATFDHFQSVFIAANERIEQFSKHNHAPSDDFGYTQGELIRGALAHIAWAVALSGLEKNVDLYRWDTHWPFESGSFNRGEAPKDCIRKAIGFLMAELDRDINSNPADETTTQSDSTDPVRGDSNGISAE